MKYHNIRAGGFDSRKEAARFRELQLMQKAGKIRDLRRQVRFEIMPVVRGPDKIGPRGGVKKGRVIDPARYYTADFVYTDAETDKMVVEDVKGYRTRDYILRKAMMLRVYGILIKET